MVLKNRFSKFIFTFLFFVVALDKEEVFAHEIVNAKDFGMTAGVEASQTSALNAAMSYFYNREVEGTVYIPAGTYSIDAAIRFYQGVSLVGDGMGVTVLKKSGNRVNYVVGNPYFRSGNNLNVTIAHLTIDADRENRIIQGLVRVGGILMDNDVSNLTLDNIEVRDTTTALLLRRLKNSIIKDSLIDRAAGHGIAFGSESHPIGDVHNNVIIGNTFTNSIAGSGINLSRATYTTVTHNKIINDLQQTDSYGGIRVPNGGAYNIIEHNFIENYPRGIFILSGAHDNTVSWNTVKNSRIHGVLIQADYNILTDNIIQQLNSTLNIESIIRLGEGSQNKILRNRIDTFSNFSNPGIRVTWGSDNNIIKDNIINSSGIAVSIEWGSGNIEINNIQERVKKLE